MADFDASSFLETVFTEPSLTEKLLCPVGEYTGVVDKLDARKWSKDGKSGVALDIFWSIESDDAKAACKRDKVLVKQGIMFSLTADGLIDMEKAKSDVRFGKLRDALGLNEGQFSPSMLPGRMAKLRITHSLSTKDGITYHNEDVAGVTAI
jgi:hypothetical protein